MRFSRERDRTILEIRTDWDTTEQVVIAHEANCPERWFLLRAKPFGPDVPAARRINAEPAESAEIRS